MRLKKDTTPPTVCIGYLQFVFLPETNRLKLRNKTKLIVNITNQRIKDVIDGYDYTDTTKGQ